MPRIANRTLGLLLLLSALAGCGYGPTAPFRFNSAQELAHYNAVATHIDMPNVGAPPDDPLLCSQAPDSVGQNGQIQYWDMALEQAMQISLSRSKVLHDLGGTVLNAPANIRTIHGPAIADTDPRYGVEAALSDFDAVFNSTVDSQHNDRLLNNVFFGGGTRDLRQDLDTFKNEIVKDTPTGTEFSFRNNTVYDHNNEPGNLFPSAWDTNFEVEARQHLLQGAGTEYNRIAGTHGAPGQYNGVMIARINTDIGLVEFQIGVRDLVSNVENAYWDLYFAYRDLDAKVAARDKALESWRNTHARFVAGRRGGEAEKEAAAREQYFQFQEEVENAWSGRLVDGTQTNNGSSGGTLRGNGGVRVAERRLRLLLGLPASDGRLIRPVDEPSLAKMVFCWEDILPEALSRRDELRRQRWQVKRRELELIASRNFLLPTFDAFGLYRWRGFGHDLISDDTNVNDFESALADLDSGKHQEWELGAEFSMPIGERKGHAAVRNAQLNLSRERAVLEDQERQVVHDLSNAIADLDRAYEVAQTAYNRRMAALAEVAATKAAYEADKAPLDLYLESQRRLADSESRFFASLVDYALAIKNVHFEKGSLLEYNDVFLAESPWPDKAYKDAAKRRISRWQGGINYTMKPGPVSAGPIEQDTGTPRRETAESGPAAETLPPPQPAPGPPGPMQPGPGPEAPIQLGPAQQGPPQASPVPEAPPAPPRPTGPAPANPESSALPMRSSTTTPSIMAASARDFDNLQPTAHQAQAAPTVIGVVHRGTGVDEPRADHGGESGTVEATSRGDADQVDATGSRAARASYIKTIPIPWSRKQPEKTPSAPGAAAAGSPREIEPADPTQPQRANPSIHLDPQAAAAAPTTKLPTEATGPNGLLNLERMPAVGEQHQLPLDANAKSPPSNALRSRAIPPGVLQTSGVVESSGAVHADDGLPSGKVVHADAPWQPSRVVPAYGLAQPSNVIPAYGIAQPSATLPAYGNSQPSTSVPAYGSVEKGDRLGATAGFFPEIGTPATCLSPFSTGCYEIGPPDSASHAGAIDARGTNDSTLIVSPSSTTTRILSSQPPAARSAVGAEPPPAGILQSFPPIARPKQVAVGDSAQALPPVGRIQNLPPIGSSFASATSTDGASTGATARDLSANTTSDLHAIAAERHPAIEKLQSLPPIGPIPPASPTNNTARPSPPIGPMQSLPPTGASDSTAYKATTQSPPGGVFQSLPPSGSAATTRPSSGPQSSLPLPAQRGASNGAMQPLPPTGGLQPLPPL